MSLGLINRLAGIGTAETNEKMSVGAFWAHLVELANGEKTQADIISFFSLDAGEQTELTWLIGQYNSQPDAAAKERFLQMLLVIFYLAEANAPGYVTQPDLVARIGAI